MRMSLKRWNRTVVALVCAGLMSHTAFAQDNATPEAATGVAKGKQSVTSSKFMAATANPYATDAAYQILKKGGSAVDAAVAAQAVLGLTEPQSSGIGGGAFLLTLNKGRLTNYDGRETAPANVDSKLFQKPDGTDMAFYDAVIGGRSVGVPGAIAMLEMAHKREGRLPWKTLFEPAIKLAREGFPLSARLNGLLATEKYLMNDPAAKAYFYDEQGKPKATGTILKNEDYAHVLSLIGAKGSKGLLTGEVGQAIVDKVKSHPSNPGTLTLKDMANYKPKIRQASCGTYKTFKVCGAGAPSSGGIAVNQMLGILDNIGMSSLQPNSAAAIHYFSEAGRLAFADRGKFVADPDFVKVDANALLDNDYLHSRAALIKDGSSLGTAAAGEPKSSMKKVAWVDGGSPELVSTSHISIVDAKGNAVSMTTSIEDQFGSRQFVKGFLLNNQLTDFSFADTDKEGLVANRVQANKRPRSSMAPVIILKPSGKLHMVVGSPGGSRIIGYVAQSIVNTIDWKMDPQTAVDAPHFGSRNGPKTEIEKGNSSLAAQTAALTAKGHTVTEAEMTSGTSIILVSPKGYVGGADSRREGTVKGD